MGLRLPLEALTWRPTPPEDPRSRRSTSCRRSPAGSHGSDAPKRKRSSPRRYRAALCASRQAGHVFRFPAPGPTARAVRRPGRGGRGAATKLRLPVVLEGYLPPFDPRAGQAPRHPGPRRARGQHPPGLVVAGAGGHHHRASTPTPGPPGSATETFHLDGTHAGTGGGNHLTLGGPTPADSPLLRRPDLLRSIITYWQHHPSLSYLFSGRFIGPTSQAPRVDEARHESLYELEIAFAELDRLRRRWRPRAALAGGPPVPQPAGRHNRQHPPGRAVHRQALQPRLRAGPARAARTARLRDATAPPHGAGAGAAGPGPGRPLLGRALRRPAGALGHRAPRPVPPALVCGRRYSRGGQTTSPGTASASTQPGWRRSSSSVSPASARSRSPGSPSSCAAPSSRGRCSAKR